MNYKKTLALISLIPALVMILWGIPLISNNYTHEETKHDIITSESVIVPANKTAYIKIELPESNHTYVQTFTVSNGSVRVRSVAPDNLDTWTNTSSLLGWNQIQSGSRVYTPDIPIGDGPINNYLVFWNPDSATDKEATVQIYHQTTQTFSDYTQLNTGIALTAAGVIIGVAATLLLGRRLFLTIIGLVMVISGAFLTSAYSSVTSKEEACKTFTIVVPPNTYAYEKIRFNETGTYTLVSDEPVYLNATFLNETQFNEWQNKKYLNGVIGRSSTIYINSMVHNVNLTETYYFMVTNQDSSNETVTYTLCKSWNEYNYVGLIGGIALIPAGVAAVYLTNKAMIKRFNRALENQQ